MADEHDTSRGVMDRFQSFLLSSRSSRWQTWLGISLAAAIFLLLLHGWAMALDSKGAIKFAAAALLIAGGAGAVGTLLGFLFGIPRSLQAATAPVDTAAPLDRQQAIGVNTNLEQISDWLTKIIVGVGLTQAPTIIDFVYRAAEKASALVSIGTDNQKGATALVLVIIVLFSILGFLQGYLWARIYLQEEFNKIEQVAKRTPQYYEGLMNSYLYMDAPSSFREALKLRDQYRESFGDNLTDRMWTYTVCALGQRYAYDIEVTKKPKEQLTLDREEFITALRRAVRGDPEAVSLLRAQLVPERGSTAEQVPELFDGDLRAFREDGDVKKLLIGALAGVPREKA